MAIQRERNEEFRIGSMGINDDDDNCENVDHMQKRETAPLLPLKVLLIIISWVRVE